MSLPHGRDISAEQIERIVGGEFTVQRFASLCNSVTWAVAQPVGTTQPAFTERVFVRDNGVDAEWEFHVPQGQPDAEGLIRTGRNVFQYKQRDVTAQTRNRIVGQLRQELRAAAQEVARRTGRNLDAYLFFTNLSLTLDEKAEIEGAIRLDYAQPLQVRVVAAADLAAYLNSLPHIRSSFFATSEFCTWHSAWESHKRVAITAAVYPLIGRQDLLEAIKASIDDDSVKAVLISGVPDIGKSRIALAATAHRPIETVFALDPVSLTVSDLLQTRAQGQKVIIAIDDPDSAKLDELITSALAQDVKLIWGGARTVRVGGTNGASGAEHGASRSHAGVRPGFAPPADFGPLKSGRKQEESGVRSCGSGVHGGGSRGRFFNRLRLAGADYPLGQRQTFIATSLPSRTQVRRVEIEKGLA